MKSFLIKLSVMLFVLLSVSISFSTVVFAKNVMVIAPHEDDETLMAAGVIKDAVTKGDTVKVVLVTNGDFQGLGLTRIQESVNALNYLGVSTGNACFLGYGDTGSSYNDSFVMKLYNATNPTQIYSSLQETQTYGNPGIGVNDYHYTKYGVHGDYNRATLLGDLQSVISENMPDDIYTTALNDGHGDHSAVFLFTNEALINIKKSSPSYSPVVHSTIIHAQGGVDDTTWPLRESDPAPLVTFTQPGILSSYSVQSWENRESIAVPAVMNTIPRATNIKHTAISMYNSQVSEAPDYLYAFTKSDEYFWRKGYSNIALLSTVSVSSEDTTNNQQGVKAIDGITDGYPRFAPRE